MKNLFLALGVALLGTCAAKADIGTYGFGTELTLSGTNYLYANDDGAGSNNGDATRLEPTGFVGNFITTGFPVSLGSYTQNSGDLVLDGGSLLTYGATFTDTNLGYIIVGNSSGVISLALDSTDPSGNGNGDERFATQNAGINLTTLNPGLYTLQTYGYGSTGGTTVYDSNNSSNYSTTFTIAPAAASPEPSTWALMIGGVLALVGVQRYRQRAVL